jgi:hypothetical protein
MTWIGIDINRQALYSVTSSTNSAVDDVLDRLSLGIGVYLPRPTVYRRTLSGQHYSQLVRAGGTYVTP